MVTWPRRGSRLPRYGWSGSGLIGPRIPAGGSRQSAPAASHAKLVEARSGTLSFAGVCACAEAGALIDQAAIAPQNAAAPAASTSRLDVMRLLLEESVDIGVFPLFLRGDGVRHRIGAARRAPFYSCQGLRTPCTPEMSWCSSPQL